jgi:cytoskeletal protein CcmA (bactofilin family)
MMTPQQLATRWEALKLAVGHASVLMDMAFHSSLLYWQSGVVDYTNTWSIVEAGDLLSPITSTQKITVLIQGDCQADISLADGALVQIYGDLASRVKVDGHCEILIGGSILPEAGIEAQGITHIFVGGDVDGFVQGTSSLKVSVHGHLRGMIRTGHPTIELRVEGDFLGQMQPTQKASLAYLVVQGFMPYGTLQSTAQHGYARFDATIAFSDRSPGIYPDPVEYKRLAQQRNYCTWVILASTAPKANQQGLPSRRIPHFEP